MPHVQVRVSNSLTQDQIEKLAEKTLNAIALIPGKSAPVTMAEIVPNCNLYYGSVEGEPCAVVDVACNNNRRSFALDIWLGRVLDGLAMGNRNRRWRMAGFGCGVFHLYLG